MLLMFVRTLLISLVLALGLVVSGTVMAQQVPRPVDQELQARGMTLEQAVNQARLLGIDLNDPEQAARRARELGVPESQIQEMLRVHREYREQRPLRIDRYATGRDDEEEEVPEELQEPDEVEPFIDEATGLEYFGYRALRGAPDAFRPGQIRGADDSYVVNPGDEIRLSVWGAAEFQYDLQVDAEGRVFVPNVGQVTVAGYELRDLRRRMRGVLSQRYAGLTTSPPSVNMDLTVARMRPVRIFVLGEVEKPGGYTIGTGSTVFQALYAVGGPALTGSLRDVRVIRNGRVVANIDLYRFLLLGTEPSSIRLQDNDHLFIPPRGKTVAIEGPLVRSALFELLPDETLDHLIGFAGGVRPDVFVQRFQIERIIPFTERREASRAREVIDLPLDEVLRRQREVRLADGDRVSLFRISELLTNPVTVTGAVFHPGRYQLSSSLRTVGDLIRAADGLRPEAFTARAQLLRMKPDRVGFDLIPISLEGVLAGDPEANMGLLPEDELRIFSADELKGEREVLISGEVREPGSYTWAAGMTLEDLILQAGGLKTGAALDVAEISRMLRTENPSRRAEELAVALAGPAVRAHHPYAPGDVIVELDEARTITLEPGDQVQVRRAPAFRPQESVTISGQVRFPGEYVLMSDTETLSSLIARAGGLRANAHAPGTRMMREERRVSVDVDAVLAGDRRADVRVLPGDDIHVPASPNAVTVVGNVGAEGVYRYVPGQRVSYYLNRSGGMADRTEAVYLEQPDGSTRRVLRRFMGTRTVDPVVEDAAVITVTRKAGEPADAMEVTSTLLRDLSSIAATTITLIVLLNRL
jgi:polysaccharide biosynthesis/export protein